MKKLRLFAPVLLVISLLFVACGSDDEDSVPAAAQGVTEVERQLLSSTPPETASGQLLELTRVIVPSDKGLPPHTHPGPQMAIVANGILTYTIIEGEVTVTRAAATDDEKIETYGAGDTIELKVGDTIIEPEGMKHEAANKHDDPVVLYLSSLFPEGVEPATLVD